MKDIGLRLEMAMDREKWRCGIMGRTSDSHKRENNGRQTSSSSSKRNLDEKSGARNDAKEAHINSPKNL